MKPWRILVNGSLWTDQLAEPNQSITNNLFIWLDVLFMTKQRAITQHDIDGSVLTQWRYCSLALTHRYEPSRDAIYPTKYARSCDIDLYRTTTKHNIARTYPGSKVHGTNTGPRWAPCCPHETCYQGIYFLAGTNPNFTIQCVVGYLLCLPYQVPFLILCFHENSLKRIPVVAIQVVVYCYLDPWEQIAMKFISQYKISKYKNVLRRKRTTCTNCLSLDVLR